MWNGATAGCLTGGALAYRGKGREGRLETFHSITDLSLSLSWW